LLAVCDSRRVHTTHDYEQRLHTSGVLRSTTTGCGSGEGARHVSEDTSRNHSPSTTRNTQDHRLFNGSSRDSWRGCDCPSPKELRRIKIQKEGGQPNPNTNQSRLAPALPPRTRSLRRAQATRSRSGRQDTDADIALRRASHVVLLFGATGGRAIRDSSTAGEVGLWSSAASALFSEERRDFTRATSQHTALRLYTHVTQPPRTNDGARAATGDMGG
jgi:hypothetical protein